MVNFKTDEGEMVLNRCKPVLMIEVDTRKRASKLKEKYVQGLRERVEDSDSIRNSIARERNVYVRKQKDRETISSIRPKTVLYVDLPVGIPVNNLYELKEISERVMRQKSIDRRPIFSIDAGDPEMMAL